MNNATEEEENTRRLTSTICGAMRCIYDRRRVDESQEHEKEREQETNEHFYAEC